MTVDQLFSKCTSCEWDKVRDILVEYPDEACAPIDTGKRGAAKISVLQVVLAHPKCRGSVPLDIISMLLKMAPQMAETRHLYTGNLPLHAVFYNAFFSSSKRAAIAEMIIRANPQSVLMTNYDGRTPLHTNCTQHCNYEPVVALLRAAPQTAKWKDKNNELPLHLACRSQKTPNKSLRALFHAYPEGIFCKNGQGLTPLEIAKASRVMEQRKTSRVALLTSLEAQFEKAQKSHGSSRTRDDKENHWKGGNVVNNLRNGHSHPSSKRKLDLLLDENALVSPQKMYRKYIEAHHFHVTGKLLGSPMMPNRIILPSLQNDLYHAASIAKIPRLTTRDYIEAIQSERRKLRLNTDYYMDMKMKLRKSIQQVNIELLRKQHASLLMPIQVEEGVAETLISLKNQN